jgi:hypothetical protein
MNTILFRTATVAIATILAGLPAMTSTANAGGKPSSSHASSAQAGRGSSYHESHGTRLKDGGYSYRGRDHFQWTHRYWCSGYGCYTYWCPSTCAWYYWYERDCCYYPISYLPTCTPPVAAAPVNVPSGVTQIVNVNNNSPGSTVGGGTAELPAPPAPPAPPVIPTRP